MHWSKRLITAIVLTVFSILLIFSVAFVYLIISPAGGKMLERYILKQYGSMAMMQVGHYQGSLQDGLILKNIRITGLSYLPDAVLRIQEIDARLSLTDPGHLDLDIFNARILMPPPLAGQAGSSDPIVFTGRVYEGKIQGELYAKSVDIHEVSRFWTSEDINKHLQGFISHIDLIIQGPVSSPRITGSFLAENIQYKSIQLTNGLSKADLTITPAIGQVHINGEVTLNSGVVRVRRVNLQLSKARFVFKGDIFNPVINIGLDAKVEDMEFHLAINGTSAEPHLDISSDPPMAPQDALQVLFTGNAWSSSTSPFSGVTSSELAENFLNYSLQDINNDQQFGLKTKLTDNLKIGAEMDQRQLPPGETNTYYSRRVNGEMDMTEHMSLNVSQQVMPQDSYPAYQDVQSDPEAETQVYVQYKKRF